MRIEEITWEKKKTIRQTSDVAGSVPDYSNKVSRIFLQVKGLAFNLF